MGKIDELKEQKADLKEIFKALIYLILGLLTGIASLIYKLLLGTVPIHMLVLGFVGLIIIFLIMAYALVLWNKMQQLNKEMRDVT